MATYTITGHPINHVGMGLSEQDALNIRNALHLMPVGGTLTYTLSGPDDAKVKGHGALK